MVCGGHSSIQLKIRVFEQTLFRNCSSRAAGAAAGPKVQLHLRIRLLNVFAAMFEGRVVLLRLTKIEGSSYFAPLLHASLPLPGNEALRIGTTFRTYEYIISFGPG